MRQLQHELIVLYHYQSDQCNSMDNRKSFYYPWQQLTENFIIVGRAQRSTRQCLRDYIFFPHS